MLTVDIQGSFRAVPDFAGSPILPISEWQISAPIRYRRHFFFPDTVPDKPSALPISYRQISADIGETGKEDEIKRQNKEDFFFFKFPLYFIDSCQKVRLSSNDTNVKGVHDAKGL